MRKWELRKIEEVNEFKYVSYTFNERATDKAHFYQGDTEESK
jgi:hypothetical protein